MRQHAAAAQKAGNLRPCSAGLRGGRRRPGFALLLVFLMAAFVAIALYRELPRVAFEAQRAKEQLLIDRGEQYKRAIQIFVRQNNGRYPATLDDLESFNNRRYLRRRYKDPMTGSDEWRLVHIGPGGMLTDSKTQKAPQGQGDNNFGTSVQDIADQQQQGVQPDQQQQTVAPWARMRQSDLRPTPFPPQGQPQPDAYGDEPSEEQAQTQYQPQNPNGDDPGYDPQQPAPGQPYYPGQQPVAGQPYTPGQPYVPGQNVPPGIPGVPGQGPVIVQRPALPWQRSGTVVTPVPVPVQNPNQYPQQAPQPAPYGTGTQFGQALGDSAYGAPTGVPTAPPNAPGTYPNQQNPAANSRFPGVPTAIGNQLFNPAANQGGPGNQGFAGPPAGSGPAGGVFGQNNNNLGGGGGIAGVASKLEQKSIMRYDDRTKYNEWEFVYDPRKDKTGMMLPGAGIPNQPGQFGQPVRGRPMSAQPVGGGPGQPGQFNQPTQPMPPSLGPGTPNQ